jgi:hypothetical protein
MASPVERTLAAVIRARHLSSALSAICRKRSSFWRLEERGQRAAELSV